MKICAVFMFVTLIPTLLLFSKMKNGTDEVAFYNNVTLLIEEEKSTYGLFSSIVRVHTAGVTLLHMKTLLIASLSKLMFPRFSLDISRLGIFVQFERREKLCSD